MSDTFEYKPGTAAQIPLLSGSLIEFAFNQAQEFVDLGHSVHQATSTVANLLLDTAWKVAANGAIADGVIPNPDRFRARVEDVIQHTRLNEEQAGEAPPPASNVALPQDVIDLVIAARKALDYLYGMDGCELRNLDKAVETFADRVPYENEPQATEGKGNE